MSKPKRTNGGPPITTPPAELVEVSELTESIELIEPIESLLPPSNVVDISAGRKIRSDDTAPAPEIFSCTDSGNAEIFARLYGGKVLFDHLRGREGKWMLWTGTRWREDDDGQIIRLASEVNAKRRNLANGMADAVKTKEQVGWSYVSENLAKISAMLRLAGNHKLLSDSGKKWDADPWLLGCNNGPVDLRTGRLIEASPKQRISRSTNVTYDPAATCPLFTDTLDKMFPTEPEMVAYIQRSLGYSIQGGLKERALFAWCGEGSNGKNTILDTVGDTLGDYAYTMPFSTLDQQSRNSISNDVAALRGYRFLFVSEMGDGVRLNEGRIKSLTGDAKITARFLHQENFTYTPTGKIHLAFNGKPRILDDSDGMWQRIHMIHIATQFVAGTVIKGFRDRLLEELPGILTWLVKGCLLWQREGLNRPESVDAATKAFRDECNPVVPFIEDCCIVNPGLMVTVPELWEAYRAWGRGSGEQHQMSKIEFGRRVGARGFGSKLIRLDDEPKTVVRAWIGLTLNENDDNADYIVEDDDNSFVH